MKKIIQWQQSVQVRKANIERELMQKGPCVEGRAIVLAGHGITDKHGKWTMDLAKAFCPGGEMIGQPSFVATATNAPTEKEPAPLPLPVVLSASISGTLVRVQAWSFGGPPSKGAVAFSWHCVVLASAPGFD
jgi:hypothetical protein